MKGLSNNKSKFIQILYYVIYCVRNTHNMGMPEKNGVFKQQAQGFAPLCIWRQILARQCHLTWNWTEPKLEKSTVMSYANSEDPCKLKHTCNLIGAFVLYSQYLNSFKHKQQRAYDFPMNSLATVLSTSLGKTVFALRFYFKWKYLDCTAFIQ